MAGELQALGCGIIDADSLANQALGQPLVRQRIARQWGEKVIRPDGQVDRKWLSHQVFNDRLQLKRLEAIIHPIVLEGRRRLRARFQNDPSILATVEDCPLLYEQDLDTQCDFVIFVVSCRATRLRRLAAQRGWSDDELCAREKNQLALDIKAQRADYVIANHADQAGCRAQVRDVFSQIIQKAL